MNFEELPDLKDRWRFDFGSYLLGIATVLALIVLAALLVQL
jgi:hypothetical protein